MPLSQSFYQETIFDLLARIFRVDNFIYTYFIQDWFIGLRVSGITSQNHGLCFGSTTDLIKKKAMIASQGHIFVDFFTQLLKQLRTELQ